MARTIDLLEELGSITSNRKGMADLRSKLNVSIPNFTEAESGELRNFNSDLIGKLDGMINGAEIEGRNLTSHEEDVYDRGLALVDIGKKIAEHRDKNNISGSLTRPETRIAEIRGPSKGREYRSMFPNIPVRSEWRSFNEFAKAIADNRADNRLEMRTFVEGDSTLGGFLVPGEFTARLMDDSLGDEIIRPGAENYALNQSSRVIAAWDSADHSSNLYGGWSMQWLGETDPGDIQTGKVRAMTITAKKGALFSECSRELLNDADGFEAGLGLGLRRAIGFYLDNAYIEGNGVAKPLGIINCPSSIQVDRTTAGTLAYGDFVNMWSRLHGSFKSNSVWIINHDCASALLNLQDGAGRLIYLTESRGGVVQDIPQQIFGRPVYWTEKNPGLGSLGDVILVDRSQYAIGMAGDLLLDKSNAPKWTSDIISFRAIVRVDGDSLWDKAITPKHGANTLSWATVLK
jgi:HK97 family phage major capsid protein